MAFPSYTRLTESACGSGVTFDWPETVGAGDLAVCLTLIRSNGNTACVGFDRTFEYNNGSVAEVAVHLRKCVGDEGGGTFAISGFTTNLGSTAHLYLIPAGEWYDSGDLAEAVFYGTGTASSNPTECAPGLGSLEFLWILALAIGSANSPSAYDTNFGDVANVLANCVVDGRGWSATMELEAASYDPTAFTISGNVANVLIAIRPGGGGPPTPDPNPYYVYAQQ